MYKNRSKERERKKPTIDGEKKAIRLFSVDVLLMNRILRLMCVDGMHRFSCNSISTSVGRNPFFKHIYIIDSFINSISRLFF